MSDEKDCSCVCQEIKETFTISVQSKLTKRLPIPYALGIPFVILFLVVVFAFISVFSVVYIIVVDIVWIYCLIKKLFKKGVKNENVNN